jgi:GTP cyclohydrolase III
MALLEITKGLFAALTGSVVTVTQAVHGASILADAQEHGWSCPRPGMLSSKHGKLSRKDGLHWVGQCAENVEEIHHFDVARVLGGFTQTATAFIILIKIPPIVFHHRTSILLISPFAFFHSSKLRLDHST